VLIIGLKHMSTHLSFLLVCLYLFSILPGRCGIYSCDEIVTGLAGDWIFIHESSLTSKALSKHHPRRNTCPLEQINRLQSATDKQNVQNTARLYSIYYMATPGCSSNKEPPAPPKKKKKNYAISHWLKSQAVGRGLKGLSHDMDLAFL